MSKISIARRRLEPKSEIGFTSAELRSHKRDQMPREREGGEVIDYNRAKKDPSEIAFRIDSKETALLSSLTSGQAPKNVSGKLEKKGEGLFVLNIEKIRALENSLLSSREVAELLGISTDTLYRHVREGRIRAYKVGGVFRFREEEIVEFLASSEL